MRYGYILGTRTEQQIRVDQTEALKLQYNQHSYFRHFEMYDIQHGMRVKMGRFLKNRSFLRTNPTSELVGVHTVGKNLSYLK